jgi:hypothetical protein
VGHGVQLPASLLLDLNQWPGLSRNDSIRLSIEMAHYPLSLKGEEIASIAGRYIPILRGALEDLAYSDFRLSEPQEIARVSETKGCVSVEALDGYVQTWPSRLLVDALKPLTEPEVAKVFRDGRVVSHCPR